MQPSFYKPVFSTTIRAGKTAIWVTLPDGGKVNIWDFKVLTHEISCALKSAFERGWVAHESITKQTPWLNINISGPIEAEDDKT